MSSILQGHHDDCDADGAGHGPPRPDGNVTAREDVKNLPGGERHSLPMFEVLPTCWTGAKRQT
jgi:hypothetical protein